MPTYREILTRAMERQGRAQQRTLAMLDGAFVVAPEDLARGPARVAELTPEIVAAVLEFTAGEIERSAARARKDVIDPVLKAGGGRVKLGPGWEAKAHRLVAFELAEARGQIERAMQAYIESLRATLRRAEAMGWSTEMLVAQVAGDVSSHGRGKGPWATFAAATRKAVQEIAGHAWTSTWLAAWSELGVDPEAVMKVPSTPAGPFRVIEGGKSG